MGTVIGAGASEVRVLPIALSFRFPRLRSIRIPFSMEAAGEKSLLPNLSCCATNGSPHPIESPMLGATGFRQEPEAVAVGSLEITLARDGDDAERPVRHLVVVSLYKFAIFANYKEMRRPLKDLCEELRISGGIILAPEGINGSICGTQESVEKVLEFIQSHESLRGLRIVESPVSLEEEAIHHGHTSHSPLGAGEEAPFRWDHVRVKLKKEIVTFGDASVMPTERVGKYVRPSDWNALISDPNIVLIDVRNMYETRIGKFKGAVDPCTTSFREFPAWVNEKFQANGSRTRQPDMENNRLLEPPKPPRIAMYCTGGIRCEKASSFLLSEGFEEVYHLEGGILKYLEDVPESESLWEGECFVFDKRVSVEHGLEQGSFKLCYGCKQPVSDADMESPKWEFGVSCPYCFFTKSDEEKERARARQRQFETWGLIGGPDKGRRNPTNPS
ncbi:rhodanese-like domain-containing protein 7 [Phalaenopsis equestris]|uniref:rhodanese-like domain-containing protein 7 n=1 Tax=Phalaenopsis equestris TaxID=78828 RepID=UPI0009E4070F|nr:rhodanese-like domain-containing protein 7 [Phalaenopsis equestris]XP_020572766.1 rhodanese-like domain-containing protein 7 [Phalaenopsis equestris]